VKEFLSQNNVPFAERNIADDEKALEELEALGLMTTPVVKIDDEIVVGFNRNRLKELLNV
jgi:glutaredoxin 3